LIGDQQAAEDATCHSGMSTLLKKEAKVLDKVFFFEPQLFSLHASPPIKIKFWLVHQILFL
jgi:hypothetical protein